MLNSCGLSIIFCIFVKSEFVMKLLRVILLSLLAMAIGCGKEDALLPTLEIKDVAGEKLSGSTIHFAAEGGDATFTIESNSAWQAKCEAEWLTLTPSSGSGDGRVVISVGEPSSSRSAVVTVLLADYKQQHCSFDVVQWVAQPDDPTDPNNPTDEPTDDPTPPNTDPDNPDNPPTDPPTGGDDPNDDPNGDDNGDDNGGNGGDDNGDNGGGDNPPGGDNPGDEPGGGDIDDPQPPLAEYGDYGEALNLAAIHEGLYYIGGRRGEILHLALGEISSLGHCCTAPFSFGDEGEPVNENGAQAAVVELKAAEGGFYLYFEGCGYLMATSSSAGALSFTDDPVAAWQFAESAEGGFEVRQMGEIDAQLIFSQRAQQDLLRSIAGDEQGGGIRMFALEN